MFLLLVIGYWSTPPTQP